MIKQIPNALTLTRLILAPIIAWSLWLLTTSPGAQTVSDIPARIAEVANGMTLAAILFVVAALTDLFDGMIARALNAHSKFGKIIDPIADKALVGLPLLVIAFGAWTYWPMPESLVVVVATVVIVGRDTLMTVLRLLAPDGEGARVSSLAKWKTALELIVVGAYLVAGAAVTQIALARYGVSPQPAWGTELDAYMEALTEPLKWLWLALLALAALLSAYTAWQYLAPKRQR